METVKFNGLLEKLKVELEGKKCTFGHAGHYVFHDKVLDSFNEKEGISVQFTGLNAQVQKFNLRDLFEDHKGQRFLNSDTLASSYYVLTATQNLKLMKLINDYKGDLV